MAGDVAQDMGDGRGRPGEAGDMGRERHAGMAPEGMEGRQRLLGGDVQGRMRDMT